MTYEHEERQDQKTMNMKKDQYRQDNDYINYMYCCLSGMHIGTADDIGARQHQLMKGKQTPKVNHKNDEIEINNLSLFSTHDANKLCSTEANNHCVITLKSAHT